MVTNDIELNIGLPASDVLNKITSETAEMKGGVIPPSFGTQYSFGSKIEGSKFKIYPTIGGGFKIRMPNWMLEGEVQDNQGKTILKGTFEPSSVRRFKDWLLRIFMGFAIIATVLAAIYVQNGLPLSAMILIIFGIPSLLMITIRSIAKKNMKKLTINFVNGLFADKLVPPATV